VTREENPFEIIDQGVGIEAENISKEEIALLERHLGDVLKRLAILLVNVEGE
jgi:hypothetical protein